MISVSHHGKQSATENNCSRERELGRPFWYWIGVFVLLCTSLEPVSREAEPWSFWVLRFLGKRVAAFVWSFERAPGRGDTLCGGRLIRAVTWEESSWRL